MTFEAIGSCTPLRETPLRCLYVLLPLPLTSGSRTPSLRSVRHGLSRRVAPGPSHDAEEEDPYPLPGSPNVSPTDTSPLVHQLTIHSPAYPFTPALPAVSADNPFAAFAQALAPFIVPAVIGYLSSPAGQA
jgi:hypothetical protein